MQGNTLKPFVFLLAVIASVSLACSLFSGGGDAPTIDNPPVQPELPTKAPVIEQPTEAPVVEQPTEEPSSGSSDFRSFSPAVVSMARCMPPVNAVIIST